MKYKIVVIPGDGIGPDVVAQGVKVLKAIGQRFRHEFNLDYRLAGAAALDRFGVPLPPVTVDACRQCNGVLFGSVGDPRFDGAPLQQRPERGIIDLRQQLGLYANLRGVKVYPQMVNATNFKPEVISDVDIVTVRDLANQLWLAHDRKVWQEPQGRRAADPLVCYEEEARRILKVAFEVARGRRKMLASVAQYNVLASSKLWREIANDLAKEYPDVELRHLAPDAAAMQLILYPRRLDVIVSDNPMVGGMLDDQSAMLGGGIGMSPSAELNVKDGQLYGAFGLHESVHGSAPDIVGQDIANPIATIRAVYTLLVYTLNLPEEAETVDVAIAEVLMKYRTRDIMEPGKSLVGTQQMGDLIAEAVLSTK